MKKNTTTERLNEARDDKQQSMVSLIGVAVIGVLLICAVLGVCMRLWPILLGWSATHGMAGVVIVAGLCLMFLWIGNALRKWLSPTMNPITVVALSILLFAIGAVLVVALTPPIFRLYQNHGWTGLLLLAVLTCLIALPACWAILSTMRHAIRRLRNDDRMEHALEEIEEEETAPEPVDEKAVVAPVSAPAVERHVDEVPVEHHVVNDAPVERHANGATSTEVIDTDVEHDPNGREAVLMDAQDHQVTYRRPFSDQTVTKTVDADTEPASLVAGETGQGKIADDAPVGRRIADDQK